MYIKSNPIINITTDSSGYILQNSSLCNNPFKNNKNIYEIKSLQPYKNILSGNFNTKKLLINVFPLNYSFFKLESVLNEMDLVQFIFEELRTNNFKAINHKQVITSELCNINLFNDLEREVIYSLLNGMIQNKEILNFLCKAKSVAYNERSIRYVIEMLYKKFNVNSKSSLIQAIKAHDLDMYLPTSIFGPGIYDFPCCQIV